MTIEFSEVTKFISERIRPMETLVLGQRAFQLIGYLRYQNLTAYGLIYEDEDISLIPEELIPFYISVKHGEPLRQGYDLIIIDQFSDELSVEHTLQELSNIAQHTESILILNPPHDPQPKNFEFQSTARWTELLAQSNFFRDMDGERHDPSVSMAWYRRAVKPVAHVLAHYENTISRLSEEISLRREQTQELRRELFSKEQILLGRSDFIEEKLRLIEDIQDEIEKHIDEKSFLSASLEDGEKQLDALRVSFEEERDSWKVDELKIISKLASVGEDLEVARAEKRAFTAFWDDVQRGVGWDVLHRARIARLRLAPRGSTRERLLLRIFDGLRDVQQKGLFTAFAGFFGSRSSQVAAPKRATGRDRTLAAPINEVIPITEVEPATEPQAHSSSVDIIVCVHNALKDVKRCLASILDYTQPPYQLILVDDGSDQETKEFLERFSTEKQATLIRNEKAGGYTRAANQGLRESEGVFVILLNSDTVVTTGWIDRMVSVAESNPNIGLVGPLSNTASWQSIPEIEKSGDWAPNPLPENVSINDMGEWVSQYSAGLKPKMPLLNGFCLLIRREVIDQVGYFDEEQFADGYGEEDDYVLRARQSGWEGALADDVYIYHSQSQSYSTGKRRELYEVAGKNLVKKHGEDIVQEGVAYCLHDKVLGGIRARSQVMFSRRELIDYGSSLYNGRSVLFILPIAYPGGGGNVVTLEGQSMVEMGVEVGIFNLSDYQDRFQRIYPDLSFNVHYDDLDKLPAIAENYDAVIATFNPSVDWMNAIPQEGGRPVYGYYIQGFEPYMYEKGSPEYEVAKASYTAVDDLVRFTKTRWTRQVVLDQVGADSKVVGVSVDIDLFRPRSTLEPKWPDAPLRLSAMVRPGSPYRAPRMTMNLLRKATEIYGSNIEVVIFGSPPDDPEFSELSEGFSWKLAGVLNKSQMANMLNEIDIFVDFSYHQAMGLTALEAMACGAAVIVPSNGGAVTFARHGINSIVVDTDYEEACWQSLQQMIEDDELRENIRKQAILDVCSYYPERPAFRILGALFNEESRQYET